MSAIGRIFVILNLILAAAFLGWASTSLARGSSLQEDLTAEQAERAKLQELLDTDKATLQATIDTERRAKDRFSVDLETAQADLTRVQEELAEAKRNGSQLGGDVTKISQTLGDYSATISQLETSKDAAISEARDLERERDAAAGERDAAVTAQRDAEEALTKAQADIVALEKSLTSSKKEVSKLQSTVDQVVAMTGVDIGSVQSVPAITGLVLQVSYDLEPGLVALNVGSEDGVKRGHVFQIYNNNDWKGQVRVENAQGSISSAVIVDMKPGSQIAQGDNAATTL